MPMECGVQHVLTVYMSSMAGVFYEVGSTYPSRTPLFNPGFLVGSVLLIVLCFMCCPISLSNILFNIYFRNSSFSLSIREIIILFVFRVKQDAVLKSQYS
jgi:hypothetical protein